MYLSPWASIQRIFGSAKPAAQDPEWKQTISRRMSGTNRRFKAIGFEPTPYAFAAYRGVLNDQAADALAVVMLGLDR
jgi:hypothetical protein